MDRTSHTITLAGLLHDIGKYFHKVIGTKKEKHQLIGAKELEKIEFNENIDKNLLITLIRKHHILRDNKEYILGSKEEDNLLKLLMIADRLDAENRINEKKEYKPEIKRIVSPLWIINQDKKLSLEDIASKYKKDIIFVSDILFPSKKHKSDKIADFINQLSNILLQNPQNPNYYNTLDSFLYDKLFYVPSYNYISDQTSAFPDISLYYHQKMVSILMYALYLNYKHDSVFKEKISNAKTNAHINKLVEELREEEILKSIYLDVSGIQNFITDIKGVHEKSARLLRGRSLYLEIIQKIIAQYLCDKLNIPSIFVLKDNGGFIHLFVPSIVEINNKTLSGKDLDRHIESIVEEINIELLNIHKGKLYIYHSIDNVDLRHQLNQNKKRYLEKRINSNLKDRKYYNGLSNNSSEQQNITSEDLCDYCRLHKKQEGDEHACEICNRLIEMGDESVKNNKIVITYNKSKIWLHPKNVSFDEINPQKKENIITYYLLNIQEDQLVINYPFLHTGLFVPVEGKKVKSFNKIAKENNNPYLALIKLDIDDLGILDLKIYENLENLEKKRKDEGLSELYLSRKYALYKQIEIMTTLLLLKTISKNQQYKDNIYVLYAGGDDIVLVAPLKIALKFVKDYYDLLNRENHFILDNKILTISGALRYEKYKFPIYITYKLANHLLEIAKNKKLIKHKYFEKNDSFQNNFDVEKNSFAYQYDDELYVLSWKDVKEIARRIFKDNNTLSAHMKNGWDMVLFDEPINNIPSSKTFRLNLIQHKFWKYLKDIKYNNPSNHKEFYDYVANPHPYINYLFRDIKEKDSRKKVIDKSYHIITSLIYAAIYDYYKNANKELRGEEDEISR